MPHAGIVFFIAFLTKINDEGAAFLEAYGKMLFYLKLIAEEYQSDKE
ncbi:hypothetical protein GGD38_005683 [Chitinophagaceae bacterium OAS944]|nr:hypothetical protein [Chitinophagaceae bacterium OAS944]